MLSVEIPYRDPLAICHGLATDPATSWLAFLDSAAQGDPRAEFSYIAVDPFQILTADPAGVRRDGLPVSGAPFPLLAQALAAEAQAARANPDDAEPDAAAAVPFRGGAIGFLGYDLGRHLERLPAPRPGRPAVPELAMGLYDTVIAFDHRRRRAFILSCGAPEKEPDARARRARQRAEALRARLAHIPERAPPPDWRLRGAFRPDQSRAAVEAAIARVIDYIRAGDIFQANLTQQMRATLPPGLSDIALYLRLRALSPAPFAAFLRCGHALSVLSASPERFLRLTADGRVETRPIKGTRPRGRNAAEDEVLAQALRVSEKDRAENLMIVDLMRNDLSRVSQPGSVRVPTLNALERFASVHHLVSAVESRLTFGLGPLDLLAATFPGGSITGAPKIRAQEIIHELEPFPRGVYCGAVAWIGFDGAMDSSIVIRTITRVGDTLLAHAGGGIVADSDPADEYEESLVKLAPLLRALSGDAA